jgi:hypothetical protein
MRGRIAALVQPFMDLRSGGESDGKSDPGKENRGGQRTLFP